MGLSGNFPDDPNSFPPFLQTIDVINNQMYGALPSSSWKHLQTFRLGMNNFTGHIPTRLLQSRNLMDFSVQSNQLTGANLFRDIAKDMKKLMVSANALSGKLEDIDFYKINSISNFRINENKYSGTIPSKLFMLPELGSINLGGNEFTGKIPTTMSRAPKLSSLHLNSNLLTGEIPDDLYNCGNLTTIYLDGNNLSGSLSTLVGNLTKLVALFLDTNQFDGTLPTELGQISLLERITFYGNDFTEQVPTELCRLRQSELDVVEGDCGVAENGIAEIECDAQCCTKCCNTEEGTCHVM